MSRSKSINEQYDKLEKIGEGSYGTVYKAKDKMTGGIVALKRIPLDVEPEGVPSTSIREIGLLRELNHPNLIELLGVSKCDDNLYLVFEYLDQDLRQLLDDETISMSESVVKSYLWQMLQAIAHCHTKRILHRDLKPQNLLIDFQGNIKLADLGLARSIDLPIQPYTHEVVTLWYRAPEILLGSTVYGPPVDIWAIGCIFAEMCTRKVLFLGDSEIDQIFRIFRTLGTPTDEIWPGVTDLPDFQRTFPSWNLRDLGEILPELKKDPLDLLKLMLIYDPFKRVAARKALTHKYFKDVTIKPLKKKSSTTKS